MPSPFVKINLCIGQNLFQLKLAFCTGSFYGRMQELVSPSFLKNLKNSHNVYLRKATVPSSFTSPSFIFSISIRDHHFWFVKEMYI